MDPEGKKKLINPKGTEAIYRSMQFSQAVKSGNMVWVSGQVGMDENFLLDITTSPQPIEELMGGTPIKITNQS